MADGHSKAKMLALIDERHAAFEVLLAGMDEARMTQAGVTGDWSVKDVLAHITMWEQWLLHVLGGDAEAVDQLRRMRTDEGDALVDQMNAATFAANRERTLADVRAAFAASYQATWRVLEALPDELLTRAERVVAGNTWDHYAEHEAMLRAWREEREN